MHPVSEVDTDAYVSDVITALNNKCSDIRRVAVEVLCKFPAGTKGITDSLLKVSQDEDTNVRKAVAHGLEKHGICSPLAVDALEKLAGDKEEPVRLTAAKSLIALHGPAAVILNAVVWSLHNERSYIRTEAIDILASLGPAAAPSIKLLVAIARNEGDLVREAAIDALGNIGPPARYVSPLLAEILPTQDAKVCMQVLTTLKKTGIGIEALKPLVAALNFRDPDTHHMRNRYLGYLMAPCADFHEEIIELLGTLGPEAKEAIPALEELLQRAVTKEEALEQRDAEANAACATELAQLEKIDKRKWRERERLQQQLNEKRDKMPVRITSAEAKVAAKDALKKIRGEKELTPETLPSPE